MHLPAHSMDNASKFIEGCVINFAITTPLFRSPNQTSSGEKVNHNAIVSMHGIYF